MDLSTVLKLIQAPRAARAANSSRNRTPIRPAGDRQADFLVRDMATYDGLICVKVYASMIPVGTGSTRLSFLEARTGALMEDVLSPFGLPDQIRPHLPHCRQVGIMG